MVQISRIDQNEVHSKQECFYLEKKQNVDPNFTRIYQGKIPKIRTKRMKRWPHRRRVALTILLVQSVLHAQGFVHKSNTAIQHNGCYSIKSRHATNIRRPSLSATKEEESTAASSKSSTDSRPFLDNNDESSSDSYFTDVSKGTVSSDESSHIDYSPILNKNNSNRPLHSSLSSSSSLVNNNGVSRMKSLSKGIRINGHQLQKHNSIVTNPLQFQQLTTGSDVENNKERNGISLNDAEKNNNSNKISHSSYILNGELNLDGNPSASTIELDSVVRNKGLPDRILESNSERSTKNDDLDEEEKNYILESYDMITNIYSDITSPVVSEDNNDINDVETQLSSSPMSYQQNNESKPKSNFISRIFNNRRGSLWKRRHARSVDEGIRRIISDDFDDANNGVIEESFSFGIRKEKREALSSLLKDASETVVVASSPEIDNSKKTKKKQKKPRRFGARTIAGLISALAEEASGLEVEIDARADTPIWSKSIDSLKINFSRLGCKPLRMGGLDGILEDDQQKLSFQKSTGKLANRIVQYGRRKVRSLEEAFNELDKDNSGALDEDELAEALSSMAQTTDNPKVVMDITSFNSYPTDLTNVNYNNISSNFSNNSLNKASLKKLARRLVNLYDTNGDGVVDREEYKNMVDDMEAIRKVQLRKQEKREQERVEKVDKKWMKKISNVMVDFVAKNLSNSTSSSANVTEGSTTSDKDDLVQTISKNDGSIVFSGLKLDMTRFVFGGIPILKRMTFGGPLILEPFVFTATGSFNKEDILNSGLLDDGLRRLVARALRRRVRGIRDLLDGAVFYGRTWNMASKQAPLIEVPKLTSVEFDSRDRMIITGRAKIRASPGQPCIEQTFKLRTKLGTRENGQYIRLKEPELAFVVECPKSLERHVVSIWKTLFGHQPVRPEPLYSYFPLVSPLKQTEDDGFNLGEDNRIKSIYIKNGALRFTISAVLRPGRFLGNHYLAMTIPNRTFILTLDRVKNIIRVARQNKLKMDQEALKKRQEENKQVISSTKISSSMKGDIITPLLTPLFPQNLDSFFASLNEKYSFRDQPKKNKSHVLDEGGQNKSKKQMISRFFFRFVEGYLEASSDADFEETHEDRKDRVTTAITEVFGSSGTN